MLFLVVSLQKKNKMFTSRVVQRSFLKKKHLEQRQLYHTFSIILFLCYRIFYSQQIVKMLQNSLLLPNEDLFLWQCLRYFAEYCESQKMCLVNFTSFANFTTQHQYLHILTTLIALQLLDFKDVKLRKTKKKTYRLMRNKLFCISTVLGCLFNVLCFDIAE